MMLLSAHRVAAYASIQCVQKTAQEDYAQASFEEYGAWQMPLAAFGGRTAFSVAEEALLKRKSQHPLNDNMAESGRYGCRKFGLYMSTTGEDVLKNDLFENIP